MVSLPYQPSNRQVLQVSLTGRQDVRPMLIHGDHVAVPYVAVALDIDGRLDVEDHAGFEHILGQRVAHHRPVAGQQQHIRGERADQGIEVCLPQPGRDALDAFGTPCHRLTTPI